MYLENVFFFLNSSAKYLVSYDLCGNVFYSIGPWIRIIIKLKNYTLIGYIFYWLGVIMGGFYKYCPQAPTFQPVIS